jgi:hypothetical protein
MYRLSLVKSPEALRPSASKREDHRAQFARCSEFRFVGFSWLHSQLRPLASVSGSGDPKTFSSTRFFRLRLVLDAAVR